MAITMEGSAVPTGNPTTSHTITIPAATQTDDILIYSATNRDADADPSVTDNDSGGNTWAKIGGSGCLTVWWKRATSGTASKTLTASGFTGSSSGVIKVYRGCRLVTPYEAFATEANASGDESMAAISSTRAGAMIVVCVGNDANDNSTTTYTATDPSTLSVVEKLSTGGSDCANAQAHGLQTALGSTGTLAWTQATNGASVSAAFALLPTAVQTCVTGSFSLTGVTTGLRIARKLTAVAGSFALTGYDVTLTVGGGADPVLVCDPGSFAWTGFATGLRAARRLNAVSGSFVWTGYDVGLVWSGAGPSGDYHIPGVMDVPWQYFVLPAATGGLGQYTKRPRL